MAKITDKYGIKNNTYFQVAKNDPKDFLDVEIGDSKQPDFYPQIKIKRWDNEVNFSARLIHDEADPIIATEEDKIKWQGKKIEAKFYDLPISEKHPEGGYEFEIILKEKPATNKVEMTIQTKELDFEYQPELTQAEKDHGANRPDDVIGSYAVYHKQNPINWVGGKEYKAGKAFHIYRPRIEDSAGDWCWGDLNIDVVAGKLTVTIPQEFLDNAVYPVRHAAGLNFGYESVGATEDYDDQDRLIGRKDTPASNGSLTSITGYNHVVFSTGDMNYGLYSTAATRTKLTSATLDNAGQSYGWHSVNVGAYSMTAGTYYYLIQQCSNVENIYYKYDTGGSSGDGLNKSDATYDGVLPDTFTGGTDTTRKISIYGTYTPSGGLQTVQAKGSVKKLGQSATVQTKGRIKQPNNVKASQAKGRIEQSNQIKTVQTKARVKKTNQVKSITAKAQILQLGGTNTIQSLARILHPSEMWSDIWSVDILTGTFTATVQAKARIKKTGNATSLSAKARIKQPNIIKTIQAKARIEQSNVIKSIQAKGRIEQEEDKTIQAKGRIKQKDIDQDIQAKARVKRADQAKQIQAKADIKQLNRTKTVQTKARIKQLNISQSIQAKGRIEQARAQTVQSKARVKSLSVARAIQARARIGGSNLKDILAKARVKKTLPPFIETDFYGIEHFESADYSYWLYAGVHLGVGQSFYAYSGGQLNNVTFYMKKFGAPTGTMVAKLYTHSGTFGTSSVPGSLLATSETIDVSILSATRFNLINFLFAGAEEVQLNQDSYYVVTVEYTGGNGSNFLVVSLAADYPEHYGNCTVKGGSPESAWAADPNADLFFYVFLAAGNLSAKARIKQEDIAQSVQAKAKIAYLDVAKTIQAKARLKHFNLSTTIGAKARIGIPGDITIDARAAIKKWGVSRVVSAKARVEQQNIGYTIQAKGRIVIGHVAAVQAKARIKKFGASQLVTAKAAIKQFNLDESIQAKAKILHLASATAQAKARIKTTEIELIQAKARLKQGAVTYSVQAKAQIATLGGENTIQTKGRIKQEDLSATAQAKGRIEQPDITKSVQAKARIEQSVAKTIQAKARIERGGEIQTVQSKARIKKLGLAKTASARARIWAFASGYVKMRRGDQLYPLVLFASDDFQALRSVQQSGIITLDNKDDFQTLRSQDQIGIILLKDNRIL